MEGTFVRDRTLKFDCCDFCENSATNIFCCTDREYKKVIFGGGANFTENDKSGELFRHLNSGLKSLEFESFFNFKQFFLSTNNFLGQFQELKELKLNIDTWIFSDNEFGELPRGIETFSINLLNTLYFKPTLDFFKSLIWDMPNLKELNLECQLLTDDVFDFITTSQLPILTKLKVKVDLNCVGNLRKLQCPNVAELFLVIEDPSCVQILDEILLNFPNLTKLKLHTYKTMPRSINAHLIKYLKVTDINCGMDYVKPLQYLTELEELDLIYYFKSVAQGNCFFSHDPYLNPNLKRLRLCGFNNNDLISLMCFENLVKSFPNLEVLVMDMPLSSQHLQMINQYFTKLTCLDIRNTDVDSKYVPPLKYFETLTELHLEQYVFTNETLREWPPMPHLRVLSLKLDNDYDVESFSKMIQNVSGIEKLSFNYTSAIGNDLIKVVADNCKRLKEIKVGKSQNTEKLTTEAVEYLQRKCLFLKMISFPFVEIFKVHNDYVRF